MIDVGTLFGRAVPLTVVPNTEYLLLAVNGGVCKIRYSDLVAQLQSQLGSGGSGSGSTTTAVSVSSASYDKITKELILSMSNGTAVKTSLAELEESDQVTAINQSLADLTTKNTQQDAATQALQQSLNALSQSVSTSGSAQTSKNTQLENADTALQNRVLEAETKLTSITEKSVAQDVAIQSLQSKNTTQDSAIMALQDKDTQFETSLSTLAGRVGALETASGTSAVPKTSWLISTSGSPEELMSGKTPTIDPFTSAILGCDVVWPDGATGTFTTVKLSESFIGAIDAYSVTYIGTGASAGYNYRIDQPAVTRSEKGQVILIPQRTVTILSAPAPAPAPTPTPSPSPSPSPSPTPSPSPSPSPAPTPAPAPAAQYGVDGYTLADPVTTAMTGLTTYNVTTDAELDAVPWCTLQAGAVVNIHYKATPYTRIFRVRGVGTQANPIIVNGVTDASGKRPVFTGINARVATGCVVANNESIFDPALKSAGTGYANWEGTALIGSANGPFDTWSEARPKWVKFQNLEVVDVYNGNAFLDSNGVSRTWDSGSGIRIQDGHDCVIDNCVITRCAFGVFTQARENTLGTAAIRPVIRRSRVTQCGVANRDKEHCMYIQGANPLVEHCLIGPCRADSLGSSLKTRVSGGVTRYNTIIATTRALDIVEAEDQNTGVMLQPDYDTDYCYGNIILNDPATLGFGSATMIHFGGGNMAEDLGAVYYHEPLAGQPTPDVTDADLTDKNGVQIYYRHKLYFVGNTVVSRANKTGTGAAWRVAIFDLSLSGTVKNPRTTVYAWDNLVNCIGDSVYTLMEYAGHVEHLGGNLYVSQSGLLQGREDAKAARMSEGGVRTESTTIGMETTYWRPTVAYPKSTQSSAIRDAFYAKYTIDKEPLFGTNRYKDRVVSTAGANSVVTPI